MRLLPVKITRKQFFVVTGVFIVIFVINNFISSSNSFWNPDHVNYFSEELSFDKNLGYLVDTSHCKILNLSAWDKSILSFVHQYSTTDCYKTHKHWTFVQGTNLVLNMTAIEESGYPVHSLHCCYRAITRVEQTLDHYDENADAVSKVSETCVHLEKTVTPLSVEFVRVKCTSKYWPFYNDIVYRNHHTLAQPHRSSRTTEKIKFWASKNNETTATEQNPPNVLIIGIDSLSRLNFQRTMQRTRQYLLDIGAIQMAGYTKVGENTLPNVQAFLSGYSEQDLGKICYFSTQTPQDDCPYVWKRFDQANYFTAHLEDTPGLNAFNRLKTGFVKQQVDYYLRPFMLDLFGPIFAKDCIGPDTQDQKVFNYIQNLYNMSSEHNTPLFVFTWLTNLAHSDLNAAQAGDGFYHDFLQSLNLNNTILFVVSDHGFRYGRVRETFIGWLEDKLPTMFVYLPPEIRKKKPEFFSALQINSGRLVSPFDFYHTLDDILREFSHLPPLSDATDKQKTEIRRQFGQSFFKEVEATRTCLSAGISGDFCPCGIPRKIPLDSIELISAAKSSVNHINAKLPSQCSQLRLTQITAGGLMDTMGTGVKKSGDANSTLTVAFLVDPGQFLFESTVEFSAALNQFQVMGNVLRMNKMNTDVSCVHDAELERICYCE